MLCLAPYPCSRAVPSRAIVGGAPVTPDALALDGDTILASRHLSRGYPAVNPDGSVNAVVEIPSGTTAKFDVDEDAGTLRWARKREDNTRREIDYLAYPVNYGMVPRTLAADGDPLDIIVLGRGIERAHVTPTRIIGVLKMAHDDTRDDKLIAVPLEAALHNGFSRLRDLGELDEDYPETRHILVLWFSHYWGKGATEVVGWGDAAEAKAILDDAMTKVSSPAAGRTAPPGSRDLRPRGAPPSGWLAGSPSVPHLR
ncbi:MAG: inorganic diphosphatase [Deltaproteobacteria bacterium]|nr:inorganic diphosphatase [Deltaproteobacteria bacterium]MDQ3297480.1 inorganic diphosphatase [Myxococcota bacterium]